MTSPRHRILKFGEFELDTDSLELTRDGEPVELRPQPATLLLLLASNAGRVVSRDEIRAAVWGDDVHVDFSHGLHSCVRQVRLALGENADEPRFIRTFPRRGYRFLAEVEASGGEISGGLASGGLATGEEAAQAAETEPASDLSAPVTDVPGAPPLPSPAASAEKRSVPVWLLFLVLVIAAAAVGSALWPGGAAVPSGDTGAVLAVLPFRALSDTLEDLYFGEGLAEEIVGALGRSSGDELTVLAANSALRAASEGGSVQEAAASLGADHLLTGTVRRSGDEVRVTAHLERLSDGAEVWGANYDGDVRDVLSIQRQITTQIVLAIGAELAVDAAVPANSGASGTPAYHAYLLGLARYKLGADEDIAASLDLFQEAIDLDPSLAEAWGGLALALSWSRIDPEETLERTRLAADRALALDPNLDTAFMARARLHLLFDWDLAAARDNFQRALALNPGSPSARMGLASVLSALGRHDEAVAQINAALQLDPLSVSTRTDSAWYRYFARRHQEAIADARLSIELEPHDVRAWHVMLYAAVAVNDQDVAREVMGHRLEDIGVAADEVARIVGLPFAEGQQAFWERYVGWVGSEQFAEYVSPTYSVPGMVFLGQHDAAIDNLREGVRTRSNWMIPFLEVIPFLDPLRTEPDFIALVEELRLAGLPQTP